MFEEATARTTGLYATGVDRKLAVSEDVKTEILDLARNGLKAQKSYGDLVKAPREPVRGELELSRQAERHANKSVELPGNPNHEAQGQASGRTHGERQRNGRVPPADLTDGIGSRVLSWRSTAALSDLSDG